MTFSTITVSNANWNNYAINKNDVEHGRSCYCREHGFASSNYLYLTITFECVIASIYSRFKLAKCEISPNRGDKTHTINNDIVIARPIYVNETSNVFIIYVAEVDRALNQRWLLISPVIQSFKIIFQY